MSRKVIDVAMEMLSVLQGKGVGTAHMAVAAALAVVERKMHEHGIEERVADDGRCAGIRLGHLMLSKQMIEFTLGDEVDDGTGT